MLNVERTAINVMIKVVMYALKDFILMKKIRLVINVKLKIA